MKEWAGIDPWGMNLWGRLDQRTHTPSKVGSCYLAPANF